MDLPTAASIAADVRARRRKAVDVMREHLDLTARLEPPLNTYAHLDAERAMRQAEAVDRKAAAGEDPGPLAGVPVSVKDLIAVGGLPFASGSRLFAGNVAAEDAPSVARLRAAGACITGKTTTSELGSKGVGDSPLTGVTRNPHDTERTPGGSSAGAAAGVAAGLVPVALGTDGGGSIRIPASFCGLVGVKATFGRVPVWPPSAAGGLARVGPIARSVGDAALVLNVVAGPDERDPSSTRLPPWQPIATGAAIPRGLRLGWCEDFRYGWASADVRSATGEAARELANALQVTLGSWHGLEHDPLDAWSSQFYGGIAARLASAGAEDKMDLLDPPLAREFANWKTFGERELAARQAMGDRCKQEIAAAFERFDLLLTPATPVTALPVGRDAPEGHEALGAVGWSYFTYPVNLAGNPAASYPVGVDADGLPIGLQLIARKGDEATLLAALFALEKLLPLGAGPRP